LTTPDAETSRPVLDGNRKQTWLIRYAHELDRLKQALEANGGNLSQAAREIGMPRYRAIRLLAAEAELGEAPTKVRQ
jgi:transcriptional regulator of acetoin/glycerol metabolism